MYVPATAKFKGSLVHMTRSITSLHNLLKLPVPTHASSATLKKTVVRINTQKASIPEQSSNIVKGGSTKMQSILELQQGQSKKYHKLLTKHGGT